MLAQLIARKRISFYACAAQLCSFVFFGGTECFILAVMAFDRFVAISFALRYNAIMNKHVCIAMAAFSWVCSGLCAIMYVAITLQLPFCTQNVIKHFFCELIPLLTIACADITITQRVLMVTGSVFQLLMPLLVVLFSYFCIFVTIIGIPSSRGRYKAFSTCTSHLIVITVTIGPAVFMYLKPAYKNSEHQDKLFSVFYTVGSPAVNPIIYSLRNKDVKKALQKLPKKYRFI
ncbi:olfactory receptor 5V1-like [Pleurodeles waltl]